MSEKSLLPAGLPLAGLIVAAFAVATLTSLTDPSAAPGGKTPVDPAAPAVVRGHLASEPPSAPEADDTADAGRHAVAKLSDTVTVTIRSNAGASVHWGKEVLGSTPLTLVRPRDSGPLDLSLYAGGYLPLHIRAYTFSDDTINARLVPVSRRDQVFGYPAALDAGVEPPPALPSGAEVPPTAP